MIEILFRHKLYIIKKEKIEYFIKILTNDENYRIINTYKFFKLMKKHKWLNDITLSGICEYIKDKNGNIYLN